MKPRAYCTAAMLAMLRVYANGREPVVNTPAARVAFADLISRGWIRGGKITAAGRKFLESQ